MLKVLCAAGLLVWVSAASADTLSVNGTVTDPDQNPVVGATVTLYVAVPGSGLDSVSGTTDDAGEFDLVFDNAAGQRAATLRASATGYTAGQANVNIANPNDGTPDTVTQDMELQVIQGVLFGSAGVRSQLRPDRAAVYTLGGRCVAEVTGGLNLGTLGRFHQPLVVRWFAGQKVVGSRVFVPAR
jgi:hypothetical protein